MIITESVVEEALRSEDIESLLEHGAPDNEYTPEVRGIMKAIALLSDSDITEERLFQIIQKEWARLFGLGEADLELRAPAFRQVVQRIIDRDSQR